MKRKTLSALLGCVLAISLLAGIVIPFAGASNNVAIPFLNPLAEVDVPYDQPLSERLDSLQNKNIVLAAYSKDANSEALRGLGQLLQKEYNCTVSYSPTLGSAWNEKTDANYNTWANFDAVVFGVAD